MNAPAAYLLDTNVVSEMMRRRPSPRVAACLDAIAGDGIGISSVTVWEILNGIRRLDPGRRRDDLGDRFQDMLDEIFDRRLFDWTRSSYSRQLPPRFLKASSISRVGASSGRCA